jgi:flagellar basal body rod protein FlgG
MSSDIYTSLSGARASWRQLENLSQNLANINTTGYKEQTMTFQLEGSGEGAFGQSLASAIATGPDFRDGPIHPDGHPSHLALRGRGFFLVESTGTEGPLLTRAGDFRLSSDGELITNGGYKVMGHGGSILIPPGEEFTVTEEGYVMGHDSGELGQIRIVDATDPRPAGEGMWTPNGNIANTTNARVVQGALEGSNVNPLGAMVELVQASRFFEFGQKSIQISDQMDQRAIRAGAVK